MSDQDLAIRDAPDDLDEVLRVADAMVRSNFFPDASTAAKAAVKILAGRELGLGPVESMRAFYVIDSRIEFTAEFLAQRVRLHPRYDYRVLVLETDRCTIAMYEDGVQIGQSTFTDADREKAGLALETSKGGATPWAKFPRNMYFARALSNAVAWFAPDVVAGTGGVTIDVVRPDPDPSSVEELGSADQAAASGDALPSHAAAKRAEGETSNVPAGAAPSADRPEATDSGEASEEEPRSAQTQAAPPPDAPHEHIAGSKMLASGKVLCVFEKPDGTICGAPFKPAPTVFTAPVDEERKDLAG